MPGLTHLGAQEPCINSATEAGVRSRVWLTTELEDLSNQEPRELGKVNCFLSVLHFLQDQGRPLQHLIREDAWNTPDFPMTSAHFVVVVT